MACCNWHLESTLTQCGLIHINYICQDPIQIKPHSGVPREPSGVWGRAIQHTSIHASPSPNSKHLTSPTPNPRVIQMQAETLYVRLSSHCSKNRLFLSRVSVSARYAPPVLAEDLGPFRTDPRTCSPDALGKRFPLCSPPQAWTAMGPKLHFLWFPDSSPASPQGQACPIVGSRDAQLAADWL